MKQYTHLSEEERKNIYFLLLEWKKKKEIADEIGRNPGTITREIRRNSTLLSRNYNWLGEKKKEHYHYLPDTAQTKSEKRRKEVNWRAPLKRPEILSHVVEHLKLGWSPDIIAGNLKLLYPNDISMHVSHECIYQFIYTKKWEELGETGPDGKPLWLKQYLLRSHKRRKKKTGRSMKKSQKIPNRIDISQRKIDHPFCEIRDEFGHFEWDSILSVRTTYSALRTELERKSRFLFVKRIPRKTADYTTQATIAIYSSLPLWSVKSTTWDNGTEHTGHEKITKELNIPIYFAEPYKSWQRGSNEHGNGMIRRFFPKWTNFDEISNDQIQKVVDYLNNRPRKILGYKTPKQVFDSYLATFL
jgi:IS30 family transposase